MKQGIVIPVYKHAETACIVTEKLLKLNLPVILVDDGNEESQKLILEKFAAKIKNTEKLPMQGVILVRLERNSGKGGAVIKGLLKADEMGLTHVMQIDADGQHDDNKVSYFLEESEKNPDMIICGYPEFDESVPKSRKIGRLISTFWAAVVTLSTELKDTHCGFRVYPVKKTVKIIKSPFIEKRMAFDIEIMVRLYWNKVYPLFFPIKVIYPKDGISNFHVVKDNILISWVFARLCIGMLLRSPLLIIRKITRRLQNRKKNERNK